ncbi:pilus assembly protein [Nitrogeniibacter aestuarii]|uniref:pilus assembly protein n=1 Tax=Nitrogeniibacter aestuarii TaxID=2815343 RepID=UPI001D111772|nr:PilC/PilY family type IV pilus protein [Nitrogeniibacter aestuarii]
MNAKRNLMRALTRGTFVTLLAAANLPAAYSATDLSDTPINVMNAVSPNIMFTLDDSGSMQFEASPEFQLADAQVPNYPTIWQVAGIQYLFPPRNSNTYNDTGDLYRSWIWTGSQWYFEYLIPDFNINNPVARYARSAAGNPMYYNPNIRYLPWRRSDGTFYPNSTPSSAPLHPTRSVAGTVNLTGTLSLSGFFVSTSSSGGYQNYLSTNFSFKPATYFRYLGTGRLSGFADPNNTVGNFQRVVITSGSTYPKSAERTDCAGSVCTYAEEIQNFANWFTYYRSRGLAARAGIGAAFSSQNENIRVGFGQINTGVNTIDGVDTGTIELGVRKFSGTDRDAFFNRLYNAQIPTLSTPLRRAADDVGQYFMRSDNAGPYGEFPGLTTGTQFSCRPNFHVLMSDGYWSEGTANEARTALARANTDGTAGSTSTTSGAISSANGLPDYTYTPGSPYSDSFQNTLADVAMYYWKNDLRTDATMKNDVKPRDTDPAFWQHVAMYNIGLGVTGSVSSDLIDQALAGDPTSINWPNPANGNPEKLDDFAHAAINSRGGFFSAAEPDVFAEELTRTLDAIVAQTSAAAAVAVTDVNLASNALNLIFSTEYESGGWTGDLFAEEVDPATGNILPNVVWAAGSAGEQLTQRAPDTRYIVTYDTVTNTGVQFQPVGSSTSSTVNNAQQTSLNTSLTNLDGAAVINYLRGDRSLEGTVYRTRNSLLGDMVNAEPVLLNPPEADYSGNEYTDYETFKSANANRERVIFVGSNDGMVHAFDALTGAELWAYIPSQALDDLNHLTNVGGLTHEYHVDGLMTTGDVDFEDTGGNNGNGTDWRTILVGGLGKGGRGFYALDVTDPTPDDEADAATRVLWEFPNASTSALYADNVGYSFGRPIILKADGEWVVVVSSGYNNGTSTGGNGHGYLFVLNARTGEVIEAIDTGVGTAANPSGLAQLTAFAYDATIDVTASQIYGGDLLGNLWRFDLSANNSSQWSVTRLAALKDSSGNPQPITTAPKLSVVGTASDSKRMIYVGTGQYLGLSDIPGTGTSNSHAAQTQTMYGLYDDDSLSEIAVRGELVGQTLSTLSNGTRTIVNPQTVDLNTKRGWYLDLNLTGERVNTDPAIAFTTLVFNTNIPNSDPCEPGGSGHQFYLDIATGSLVPGATVVAEFQANALLSRPVLFRTTSGQVRATTRTSAGETLNSDVPTPPGGGTPERVSWRELPEVSQ